MYYSRHDYDLANIVSIMYEAYDWHIEIDRFHDRASNKTVPNLVDNITFEKLKTMPIINAFKAVLAKNLAFNPKSTAGYEQRFASHFGSFDQAQSRFEIMEEDDWYIFRYTLNLNSLYPKLLIDQGSYFEEENAAGIKTAREAGYKVLAYKNTQEGNIKASDNLSLVVLDPDAILIA